MRSLGVEAIRAAGLGLVIGIDRTGQRRATLLEHGANLVVRDLGDHRPAFSASERLLADRCPGRGASRGLPDDAPRR